MPPMRRREAGVAEEAPDQTLVEQTRAAYIASRATVHKHSTQIMIYGWGGGGGGGGCSGSILRNTLFLSHSLSLSLSFSLLPLLRRLDTPPRTHGTP